jgi:hypothetical protein
VSATYGIEVDAVKCMKAVPFVDSVTQDLRVRGVHLDAEALPKFICAPIEEVGSIEPATHVYAAWEGFSPAAKECIGRLFSRSSTARCIAIVQRGFRARDPAEEMRELGFGDMTMVSDVAVKLAGSARQLRAYCFVKAEERIEHACEQENLVTLPAFRGTDIDARR